MSASRSLVIGGGAAGLMAAISAAGRGESVVVLEGNEKLGRKILISGNGRCNLTNVDADSVHHYHSSYPGFPASVLAEFPLAQTLAFFAELGIETHEEKRGRLFPASDQAQSVVTVLADRLQVLGVEVVKGAKVCRLERTDIFRIYAEDGRQWQAERVVMASGGISAPKLGADRSGLDLAAGFGHTCTPLYPGLVPLVSPDPHVRRMRGVKVVAEVGALVDGKEIAVDVDDLLLTPYGVSGFTVLNLSARLVPHLERGMAELKVNLFPGKSPEPVSQMLKKRWEQNPHRSLEQSFVGLLSSKLVGPFLGRFGFAAGRRVDALTKAERWRLSQALTDWRIGVQAARPFDFAEVTIGGIQTGEVDPETLESFMVPGLYFAGEMLDVHGDLGGYNFQWAWASGHLAGQRRGS